MAKGAKHLALQHLAVHPNRDKELARRRAPPVSEHLIDIADLIRPIALNPFERGCDLDNAFWAKHTAIL